MEPPRPGMRRVTAPKVHCPNPLFEQWLDEWRQEAANKGSDMQYCFGKALKSLRKYPLRLKTGKECLVLESFGNRLCQLLDRRLTEYRKTHPEDDGPLDEETVTPVVVTDGKRKKAPQKKTTAARSSPEPSAGVSSSGEPPQKVARRSASRAYVPAPQSGPYAILVTLLKHEEQPDYPGFMSKAELQKEAQPLCSTSFTRPDPGSRYTAWSSMSQLIKKSLVEKWSNPAKFKLTDDGRDLAQRVWSSTDSNENEDDFTLLPRQQLALTPPVAVAAASKAGAKFTSVAAAAAPKKCSVPSKRPPSSTKNDFSVTHLSTGSVLPSTIGMQSSVHQGQGATIMESCQTKSFSNCKSTTAQTTSSNNVNEIDAVLLEPGQFDILLLVDTAETTGNSKKRHDQTLAELTEMKVPFEVRRLSVGDFLWIARHRATLAELILPYIVERKRMDDLAGSIKDQRFKEQKFRLKQSGIQNLIYLVENLGSNQHVGLPLTSLQQASTNTQIVDNFTVKHTIDHRHSMAYLATLTRIFGRLYLNKTLMGCSKKDLAPSSVVDDFVTLLKFQEFAKTSGKIRKFNVKEMFIRHLLQMKNLSVEKAIAIVNRYPTPQALMQAYSNGGGPDMLATIPCATATNRNVGPATSKAVYQLYSSMTLT